MAPQMEPKMDPKIEIIVGDCQNRTQMVPRMMPTPELLQNEFQMVSK